MTVGQFVATVHGIDEIAIWTGECFKVFFKNCLPAIHDDDVIDEVFIQTHDDGTWVTAEIYLK